MALKNVFNILGYVALMKGLSKLDPVFNWAHKRSIESTPDAALREYVERHDAESVLRMLAKKADPNYSYTEKGKTESTSVLLYAAQWGDAKTVKALLDAGAKPDQPASDGTTALIALAKTVCSSTAAAKEETAKLLLDAKANPDLKDRNGSPALHYAARHASVPVFSALIENGADGGLLDGQGRHLGQLLGMDKSFMKDDINKLIALYFTADPGAPPAEAPQAEAAPAEVSVETEKTIRVRASPLRLKR
ncbi:MAG: ankyrin repeat domain-containing protein [Alphaproteobacteria bacterium]